MEQKKTVKLSEGTCCAYCCGDCGWSEPGGDSSGKIWCTRNKAYYYPYESSNGCSGYFTRKLSIGNINVKILRCTCV